MTGPAGGDPRAWIRARLAAAMAAAGLPAPDPASVVLELPREFAHGDLACPAAFAAAKAARRPPREIAEALAAKLRGDPRLEKVEVAGGGYVNLFLGAPVWSDLLARVAAEGAAYGRGAALEGEKVLVEFVSANPTGPLVVANARAAAFGEALCRVMAAQGAAVEREYYVNDAGAQVRNLALSVEARWREAAGLPFALPEDGYRGAYVAPIAAAARERFGDGFLGKPDGERIETLREFAVERMLASQQADLERLRVRYDRWFRERDLHGGGLVARALADLEAKGEIFEADGAKWFRATKYGDEKDRVLLKRDGLPTYTLPDVAYHRHKFARGFTRVIDVVGADHQVEMATLRAALGALGEPVDRFEVIIYQFVTLKRGTETVKMSKRSGDVVALAELVDEVGPDAARFLFVLRSPNSHLEFDLELATATTMENPVYYVQYAHARLSSLIDRAAEAGMTPGAGGVDAGQLGDPEPRQLLRKLGRFPLVVEKAATSRQPHLLAHELMELGSAVHQFYTQCRVVGAETAALGAARLALAAAARQVVRNGLDLLGVSAPDRM